MATNRLTLPGDPPAGTWVQTERAAHEAWIGLIDRSPLAAKIMHLFANRVGDKNAVVVSQGTIAKLLKAHRRSVNRAIALLEQDRWIEIRQIGVNATVNAYVLNDRTVWHGSRDGLRLSLFSATVVVAADEQPDAEDLGRQPPLRKLPMIFPGERQLPVGNGLPPPSQPSIPGMETDLPAIAVEPEPTSAQLIVGGPRRRKN